MKKSQNHGNPPRTKKKANRAVFCQKQARRIGPYTRAGGEKEKKNPSIPHVLPWNQTTTERTSFASAKFIARVCVCVCPREQCFMTWGRSSFHPGTFYFPLWRCREGSRPPPTPRSLVNARTYAYMHALSVVAMSFTEGKTKLRRPGRPAPACSALWRRESNILEPVCESCSLE